MNIEADDEDVSATPRTNFSVVRSSATSCAAAASAR
jgi:hypothetical protein